MWSSVSSRELGGGGAGELLLVVVVVVVAEASWAKYPEID